MRSLLLVAALALAGGALAIRHLPASEAKSQAAIRPAAAQHVTIKSVSLDGRQLPLSALRAVLDTQAGQPLDESSLGRDRAVLEEALNERGYLAAKVALPTVTVTEDGSGYVTFSIDKGPLFRIGNVTVTGATATDAGVVTLAAGEVADGHRIANARQALESRLRVRSAQTLVVTKLVPDVAAGLVDIELGARR